MEDLPHDWFALLALVFVLGLKHGLDADHLAAIDGLTRYNSSRRVPVARWCGLLFSLGHGAVVITVSIVVGVLAARWAIPAWLDDAGIWISISFLFLLGLVNLHAVIAAPSHEVVRPVGVKGRFLGRVQRTGNPMLIAAIGALFALSFDTISQTSLFALTARQFGGWVHAFVLGLSFIVGMIVTDAINGLWMSRLLRRTDRLARIASRIMGLAVAGVSLLVAGFGAARYFSSAVESWSEGRDLYLGASVIIAIALTFIFAMRLPRAARVVSSASS